MNITIFKNIKETSAPFHRGVGFVLGRIKDGASKELVMKIRSENSKSTRNELKKELPAICFSGTFSQRRDDAMIEHSGLLCLDFDGYGSQSDMLEDKETFSKDKYVYAVFISPSGKGLKVDQEHIEGVLRELRPDGLCEQRVRTVGQGVGAEVQGGYDHRRTHATDYRQG